MLTIDAVSEGGTAKLQLAGSLCIDTAARSMPKLLSGLIAHADVELDLSGITGIDTAGVQLLLLAKREAIGRGQRLRLVAHSQAVIDLFELYQLGGHFGDPMVLPAPRA